MRQALGLCVSCVQSQMHKALHSFHKGHQRELNLRAIIAVLLSSDVNANVHCFKKKNQLVFVIMCFARQFYMANIIQHVYMYFIVPRQSSDM